MRSQLCEPDAARGARGVEPVTEPAWRQPADRIDIHAPLPDAAMLDAKSQLAMARRLRGELRPELIRRLTALPPPPSCTTSQMVDRLEADLRLQEVDAYAAELERMILSHTPPVPSERMPVRLHDLKIEPDLEVSARTELFFSPTTKCIVHGPDILRYAAGLAEHLLRPGEALEELEFAHWRRAVLSNIRLTVRAREPSATMAIDSTACVLGTLRTTSGRRLDYRGEVLPAFPIFEESGHNECALSMLRPLRWMTLDGHDALRLSLPTDAPWLEALNRSRAFGLFILVELLGLLTGFKAEQASATHLSVKIEGLPVPERLGDLFQQGLTLEYERVFEHARQRLPQTQTVPFRYRFRPFQQTPRRGLMAITELPISELIALSSQQADRGRAGAC
jgi:hypothetical protein